MKIGDTVEIVGPSRDGSYYLGGAFGIVKDLRYYANGVVVLVRFDLSNNTVCHDLFDPFNLKLLNKNEENKEWFFELT